MAEIENGDENPLLIDTPDLEPLSDMYGLSEDIFRAQISTYYDVASHMSDSEESLVRRIVAVEESILSQMLEILEEEEAKIRNERYES
jgi:hypothetical protein